MLKIYNLMLDPQLYLTQERTREMYTCIFLTFVSKDKDGKEEGCLHVSLLDFSQFLVQQKSIKVF